MTILRRHLSRLQWVMAWEAAFHRAAAHSPPQPGQWGSPEKARHCRWGQNLLAEWKRQCHLFLFLTLIVRIQYEKVTPIITFFAKKKRRINRAAGESPLPAEIYAYLLCVTPAKKAADRVSLEPKPLPRHWRSFG